LSRKNNKVVISGSIDADVVEALTKHCEANPRLSRSAVMTQALRQLLFPEHQEERERVLTENLDRLWWHQHNQADRVNRELRTIEEMLALFVRTFYNHTPQVPDNHRDAAATSGEKRFSQFLEALAANLGPGKSVLERMPEPAVVPPDDDAASPTPVSQPAGGNPDEMEFSDEDHD